MPKDIGIRLDDRVVELLDKRAKEEGKSRSKVTNELLKALVADKKNMKGLKEIGKLREIKAEDLVYWFHQEGNPITQALMIEELLGKGWTQGRIAEETGMSQPKISSRLKLLNLHPKLQARAIDGELLPSVCQELASMPLEKQEEYVDKDVILLREVEEDRRRQILTRDVMGVLNTPLPTTTEGDEARAKVKCPECGHEFAPNEGGQS